MNRVTTPAAALLPLVLLAAGCNTGPAGDPFRNDTRGSFEIQPTLQAAAAGVAGSAEAALDAVGLFVRKPPRVHAETLADPGTTPDQRFRAVNGLVRRPVGQASVYSDAYAAIATDRRAEDPIVRAAAVRAVNRSGSLDHHDVLFDLADDPDTLVRLEAAKALSRLPTPGARPVLLARATDTDEDTAVRLAAVYGLRHYREPEVVERLVALLEDPIFAVNFTARQALVQMLGVDRGYLPASWLPSPVY